jgi:hypothetical protein
MGRADALKPSPHEGDHPPRSLRGFRRSAPATSSAMRAASLHNSRRFIGPPFAAEEMPRDYRFSTHKASICCIAMGARCAMSARGQVLPKSNAWSGSFFGLLLPHEQTFAHQDVTSSSTRAVFLEWQKSWHTGLGVGDWRRGCRRPALTSIAKRERYATWGTLCLATVAFRD